MKRKLQAMWMILRYSNFVVTSVKKTSRFSGSFTMENHIHFPNDEKYKAAMVEGLRRAIQSIKNSK